MPELSQTVPTHLGLIPDGNRRWARSQGLPKFQGHRIGTDNFIKLADAVFKRGVRYVTVYAFSTENWQRPPVEIKYLMTLLLEVATKQVDEMHRLGIRVRFLGSPERLSLKILRAIEQAEAKTAANLRGDILFCINYGGQDEIVTAVRRLVATGVGPEGVTTEAIMSNLYQPDVPPLDLIIRTSGEQRLSNFMLWRSAYAELVFVDKHWPEFSEADLDSALAEYARRTRRFGQ